eukprot:4635656-Pyramimonas_sp.AAC.1
MHPTARISLQLRSLSQLRLTSAAAARSTRGCACGSSSSRFASASSAPASRHASCTSLPRVARWPMTTAACSTDLAECPSFSTATSASAAPHSHSVRQLASSSCTMYASARPACRQETVAPVTTQAQSP